MNRRPSARRATRFFLTIESYEEYMKALLELGLSIVPVLEGVVLCSSFSRPVSSVSTVSKCTSRMLGSLSVSTQSYILKLYSADVLSRAENGTSWSKPEFKIQNETISLHARNASDMRETRVSVFCLLWTQEVQ